jgi:ribosomal protein S12 methylthiotransferase accessory factor
VRRSNELLGTHKDSQPEATIRRIRQILDGMGIQPIEEGWQVFSEHCYSSRLVDPLFPAAGTNGKGISRPFALASAYGEFMERIQNGVLYDNHYGLMPQGGYYTPDARQLATADTLATIRQTCATTMDTSEEAVFALLGDKASCVPFWNVGTRQTVYLPWHALYRGATSNGMCAGNTPEEALLEGLCEICERFAIREVYQKAPPLPSVPRSALGSSIRAALEEIEEADFHIVLKDCSLGGAIPVVALILLGRSRTGYRVAFGSDPILDVAVQRCMTEAVQGFSRDEVEGYLTPLDPSTELPRSPGNSFAEGPGLRQYELERQTTTSAGQVPATLFVDRGRPRAAQAFQRSFVSHGHSLRWLANRILSQGFSIWVRDVSFLGFPSYQLYVPGMSEMLFIDGREAQSGGRRLRQMRRCLLDLPGASAADLRECADYLHSFLAGPSGSSKLLDLDSREWTSFLTGVSLHEDSDFRCHAEILFASMHHRVGEYRQAAAELGKLLQHGNALDQMDPPAYILGCAMYFRLRAEGADGPVIRRSIASVFGNEIAGMVLKDLRRPEDAFRHMTLPRCGDCSRCPVRGQCRFPRWKEVGEAFARAARVPPTHETGIPALRL